ncbi:MAG: hypothetical protein H0X36_13485 [Sphingomonadaceae bacterium]|nr:hypothetical protein [Sphingomonadaceae bacterium]
MRDQLDHLPQSTQRELAHVVRLLFEEFDSALRPGTGKWSKQGRIFKIDFAGIGRISSDDSPTAAKRRIRIEMRGRIHCRNIMGTAVSRKEG